MIQPTDEKTDLLDVPKTLKPRKRPNQHHIDEAALLREQVAKWRDACHAERNRSLLMCAIDRIFGRREVL